MPDRLLREFAPVSDAAWALIDAEARRTIESILGGRRVVDFRGPEGWQKSAIAIGRTEPIAGPGGGIEAQLRRVQPLVELRRGFELERAELDAVARGAQDPNLDAVIEAAREVALAEDRAIFHGYAIAAIKGICEGASTEPIMLSDDYRAYPQAVATALSRLRDSGVDGPFAIVLGRRCFIGLTETTAGGYPVFQHVRDLIEGPIVRAPAVDGAAVLSTRGGDFELVIGEDFSVGYLDHDARTLRLCVEESMTFRLISPQAAVALAYASGSGKEARPRS